MLKLFRKLLNEQCEIILATNNSSFNSFGINILVIKSNFLMKTIEEIRVEALRSIIKQLGSAAALNRSLGRNERDSSFSQILNGAPGKSGKPKAMGSELARFIESSLGLERGWMDNSSHSSNVVDPNIESLKSTWPFSVPHSHYLALSMSARKRLNEKVVDFIDGVLAATPHDNKIINKKTGTLN